MIFLIPLSTPKCGHNLDPEGKFEGGRGERAEGRHERQGMEGGGGGEMDCGVGRDDGGAKEG